MCMEARLGIRYAFKSDTSLLRTPIKSTKKIRVVGARTKIQLNLDSFCKGDRKYS